MAVLHAQTPAYTVTDLGTLGYQGSGAAAINNSGQIVGDVFNVTSDGFGAGHAYIYTAGVMRALPLLGGSDSASAYAISANGQVTGFSIFAGASGQPSEAHAMLYAANGSLTDLGTLSGGTYALGRAVNNTGWVAGYGNVASGLNRAFLYTGGALQNLGTFAGQHASISNSYAFGLNNAGQAVGCAEASVTTQYSVLAQHAFLYTGGQMLDLGTLGGDDSAAYAINDAGQITGYALDAAERCHAFLYAAGMMRDVGTLGDMDTFGSALNDRGDVVGFSLLDRTTTRAFLALAGDVPRDLNDLIDPALGWNLERANGINDSGEIVGTGQVNGQTHAFLLTPNAVVPEPSTIFLLTSGGAGLAGCALRRSWSRRKAL